MMEKGPVVNPYTESSSHFDQLLANDRFNEIDFSDALTAIQTSGFQARIEPAQLYSDLANRAEQAATFARFHGEQNAADRFTTLRTGFQTTADALRPPSTPARGTRNPRQSVQRQTSPIIRPTTQRAAG